MKRHVAKILLIFHLIFSSGVVVYAFECVDFRHVHISLLHKVDCSDFPDEHELHLHVDSGDCHCGDNDDYSEELPSLILNFASTKKIHSGCGINKTMVFSIGADILHVLEMSARILTNLQPVEFHNHVINFNTYENIKNSYFHVENLPPKNTTSNHVIVCYIHAITSVISEKFDDDNIRFIS